MAPPKQQQPPQGVPQQPHMMGTQPFPTMPGMQPGMMLPPAVPGMLPPPPPGLIDPQQQQQMFQRMMATGQRPPIPMLPTGQQNPHMAAYMRAMQQNGIPPGGMIPFPPPMLPPRPTVGANLTQPPTMTTSNTTVTTTTGKGKGKRTASAAAQQQASGGGASGSQAASGSAALPRRRRAEASVRDEKSHRLLPESPLFVALQDEERRVDALLARKRAEVQEAFSAAKRGPPAGPNLLAGTVRKRLRLYLVEQLGEDTLSNNQLGLAFMTDEEAAAAGVRLGDDENGDGDGDGEQPMEIAQQQQQQQPQQQTPPQAANPHHHQQQQPSRRRGGTPAWAMTLTGRLVDPDGNSSHPGGGGSDAPTGEDPRERVPRPHHFTHYIRKLTVAMKFPSSDDRTIIWERYRHDRAPKDSFSIRRAEERPTEITITIEIDRSPALYTVPPELEQLLGLSSGPAGGTYSTVWLVQKIWGYARQHALLEEQQGRGVVAVRFDAALSSSLKVPSESPAAQGEPQDFAAVQRWIKSLCVKPQPITVVHKIDNFDSSSRSTSRNRNTPFVWDCIDVHYEVPLMMEGALPDRVSTKLTGPDRHSDPRMSDKPGMDQLDDGLNVTLTRQREAHRRRKVLAAFAAEPALYIHELTKLYGREVRVNVNKDGKMLDNGEVMKSGDAYHERWVADAAQKYLGKVDERKKEMQKALKDRQQAIQQEVMAQAAMFGAAAASASAGGGAGVSPVKGAAVAPK